MRILHTNMLRGWGGQSNRILTEALGVARQGHDVALAVPKDSELARRAQKAGLEVLPDYHIRPPAQLWTFLPDVARFRGDLRRWKPDLIHLHGSPDSWMLRVAKSLGGPFPPVIRTRHNMFPWRPNALNHWLHDAFDAYVVISNYTEERTQEWAPAQGKPRTLIRSVPDLAKVRADVQPIRHEITALRPGDFLWGTTARLRHEKAHDVLLDAFALVHKARPASHLVLAGDGSERAALTEQARRLGLLPHAVTFLGFRTDIPAVLRSLDAYVLATRSEALGTSVLEAMAAGLPVVSTRVGGVPDSVRHERTGFLVEPEQPGPLSEAMIRLMDDPDLRRRFGAEAVRVVEEEFTEPALVARTIAFYQEVLQRYPNKRPPA